jgi:hypothetical protein
VLRAGQTEASFFSGDGSDRCGKWCTKARRKGPDGGRGVGAGPHLLPVPLPAERRNIDTDYEYLAGSLRCRVCEWVAHHLS